MAGATTQNVHTGTQRVRGGHTIIVRRQARGHELSASGRVERHMIGALVVGARTKLLSESSFFCGDDERMDGARSNSKSSSPALAWSLMDVGSNVYSAPYWAASVEVWRWIALRN